MQPLEWPGDASCEPETIQPKSLSFAAGLSVAGGADQSCWVKMQPGR